MRIAVLAGGIGAARFLRGLLAAAPDAQVTVVGNTGDDITLHGLRICPDLDTVMYTLGGGIHEEQGWGRKDETFAVQTELGEYGAGPDWMHLGDRDIATHLIRTRMLDAGYPLSAVTAALCERWKPGVELIPMSDDRVETHVVLDGRAVHFQEWWLAMRAAEPARGFVGIGADTATPAPGVIEAIAEADVLLLPPSNPVVSIGAILAVPGIRDAVAATAAPVVGLSPIVGGAAVRGMADACLRAIGVECSAAGVGAHYGARGSGGLLDGWLVDTADADTVVDSVRVVATPLLMHSTSDAAAMAAAALELAGSLR
jgi:LPPG:FO 2-phospho-L-lactate transferase